MNKSGKPSYEELEKRIEALENDLKKQKPVEDGDRAGEEGLYLRRMLP